MCLEKSGTTYIERKVDNKVVFDETNIKKG